MTWKPRKGEGRMDAREESCRKSFELCEIPISNFKVHAYHCEWRRYFLHLSQGQPPEAHLHEVVHTHFGSV